MHDDMTVKEITRRRTAWKATELIGSRQKLRSDPYGSICVPNSSTRKSRTVLLLLVIFLPFLYLAVAVLSPQEHVLAYAVRHSHGIYLLYSSCKQHPLRLMLAYSLSVMPNRTLIQRLHPLHATYISPPLLSLSSSASVNIYPCGSPQRHPRDQVFLSSS